MTNSIFRDSYLSIEASACQRYSSGTFVLCISENDRCKFVSKLKDTANNTLVVGMRPGDETKVREVVLHAGDEEVRLEVNT